MKLSFHFHDLCALNKRSAEKEFLFLSTNGHNLLDGLLAVEFVRSRIAKVYVDAVQYI